jgi:hypothetical protein
MMPLYEAIDVWRRISPKRVTRYRCFKNLSSGRYSVQSADFYQMPFQPKQAANLDRQSAELIAEQSPDERAGSFESIEAAIEAHDRDFGT